MKIFVTNNSTKAQFSTVKLEKNRIEQLDILRGIACLLVLIFHYSTRYFQIYGNADDQLFTFSYGAYGVNLFFIISGFVIFMTVEKSKNPIDFIVARFSRLYPVYWVAVILTFSMVYFFGLPGREVSAMSALINLSMFQSFISIEHVDGVYWSLKVELLFYFSMIILMLFNLLKKIKSYLIFLLSFAILDKFIYIGLIPSQIKTLLILGYIQWFFLGVIIYQLYKAKSSPKMVDFLIVFFCLILCFDRGSIEITLYNFFTVLIFLAIFYNKQVNPILKKIFVFLGIISYPLYLIHQNIGYILLRSFQELGLPYYISIIVTILFVLRIANFLSDVIERPALNSIRLYYKNIKTQFVKPEVKSEKIESDGNIAVSRKYV